MMLERMTIIALVFAAGTLGGQTPQDKKDPQSKFEPRSNPGAGQKLLAKFVGDWDVVKVFHPRTGAPVQTKGTCRQTMIHDGRFLQSDFIFGTGAGKTSGMGLIGFEAETGKFTSIWTDSRSTRVSLRQSQDKFNGDEIVLYGRTLGEGVKEGRRSRTVTRLEDDGNLVHRQWNIDADGKERLMMELLLTRKDAPRPSSR
jgi:Protein of unknown function (DUF1579)